MFAALACITSSICGEILQKLSPEEIGNLRPFQTFKKKKKKKTDARAVESVVRLVSPQYSPYEITLPDWEGGVFGASIVRFA